MLVAVSVAFYRGSRSLLSHTAVDYIVHIPSLGVPLAWHNGESGFQSASIISHHIDRRLRTRYLSRYPIPAPGIFPGIMGSSPGSRARQQSSGSGKVLLNTSQGSTKDFDLRRSMRTSGVAAASSTSSSSSSPAALGKQPVSSSTATCVSPVSSPSDDTESPLPSKSSAAPTTALSQRESTNNSEEIAPEIVVWTGQMDSMIVDSPETATPVSPSSGPAAVSEEKSVYVSSIRAIFDFYTIPISGTPIEEMLSSTALSHTLSASCPLIHVS